MEEMSKKLHDGGEWAAREDGEEYCSFCGSMTVERAIELLRTEGTHYSGSDWKYGWPHKFYIHPIGGHGKFYTAHLKDCSKELLEEFSELSGDLLGIYFDIDDKGLLYRALSTGFQTWGVVGEGPDEYAPKVPLDWRSYLNPSIH